MVSEYRMAILARFLAVPGPGTDPMHIHHYLWNCIAQLHDTLYRLEIGAFFAEFPLHQTSRR